MKKRIMHIVQSTGGVKNYIYMLLNNMDKSKFEHILVCSKEYNQNDFVEFIDLVDTFKQIDMEREINIIKDGKAIFELRKVIKKYKPDFIYLHSSKAGALGRIANIGMKNKVLYNPHGWAFNMKCSKQKQRIYNYIEKALSFLTDKIIAISDFEKQSAIEKGVCNSKKIDVIFNGIDVEKIEIEKPNYKITRKSLNIPENAYVIGMVGRISKQKAPDTFIKAAKLIEQEIPNAFFIIVGDGEDKSQLLDLITNYKLNEKVIITGWVKNPLEYVQLFNQAMLLSRWEGFGLAITEYMISKKPIIATKVDAIPNLIKNEENGLLVEADNIEDVKEAVVKIYNNKILRDKIINNAYDTVKNKFNIKRVSKEHEGMIESLCKK